ncbi:MAG: dTDP-4-dehydrorhamnose reductase [Methylococcales bacterium]|nr:dTDP-4-dehydrorhamnose reductase [Methylococcales bacterium]
MKILLFGKGGQVGWELQRSLAPLGELVCLGSDSLDLCGNLADLHGMTQTIRTVAPNVIVNAAAYTAVDKAESEPEQAALVNAGAPAVMAEEARRLDALLVHYSTDYVFAGDGVQAWRESDPTGPLGVYGKTKLDGELAISRAACRHLIFRTSWVYGLHGGNFVKTMLRLALERDKLSVINDQIGAPTGAELLADVTAHAIRIARQRPELDGAYHLAAAGETSWYGYAAYIIETARQAGLPVKVAAESILPIASSEYPTPAVRPKNSRLDTRKLQIAFDLHLPHWQTGVGRMLAEMFENR